MRFQGLNAAGEEMSSAFVQHDPVVYKSSRPSRTRQEFAADCDINTIMSRYEKTGVISHVNQVQPAYLDLSETPDLQGALHLMDAARAAFAGLPAIVRREFDNDPVKFVGFAQNPDNIDRMREWGLAEPLPPEPAPTKVEIVNPAPEAPKP